MKLGAVIYLILFTVCTTLLLQRWPHGTEFGAGFAW